MLEKIIVQCFEPEYSEKCRTCFYFDHLLEECDYEEIGMTPPEIMNRFNQDAL